LATGDLLCEIHARSESAAAGAATTMSTAMRVGDSAPATPALVLAEIA
jgi:hypothetical protein